MRQRIWGAGGWWAFSSVLWNTPFSIQLNEYYFVKMSLCSACRRVYRPENFFYIHSNVHHWEREDLRRAASIGCYIRSRVWSTVEDDIQIEESKDMSTQPWILAILVRGTDLCFRFGFVSLSEALLWSPSHSTEVCPHLIFPSLPDQGPSNWDWTFFRARRWQGPGRQQ